MRRDPDADARRSIVRKATLYSVGFLAAGLIVALAGAALVAWLLSRGDRLPFLETWLIVTVIIVLPGLVAALWKLIRDR
ncbi:MAG TPA: hypothetical protein VFZ69_06940 [Longimicrobiales bacterium]